jgi:hypothetical protein
VVSKTGRAEVATDPMSVDFSDIYIELKPPSEWKTAHTKDGLVEKLLTLLILPMLYGWFVRDEEMAEPLKGDEQEDHHSDDSNVYAEQGYERI